jgi:oxalate decarboxylase/phosphoglucose isomerase-like protein (cupin superfamily)
MNMPAEATLSQVEKAPLEVPKRHDTFKIWMEAQGIPIFRGYYIEDIKDLELEYWDLKGVPASFVVLEGTGGLNDGYICEIPPGGKTKPQRHLYEEMIYVAKGHGTTTVWQRDGHKHSFEWGPGALFAIPLNAYYQHFNASGVERARYYAVTNCSFIMNTFHNVDFIFDNDFSFKDRFDPERPDYFNREEILGRLFMTTNFVSDTHTIKLYDYRERGKGGTNLKFNMAGQSMGAHISEFPVGSYKKGHRHGPGAQIIIINGKGYTVLWPPGGEPLRVNWRPGTVVVPPDQWLHQHFNSGSERARYLAISPNSWRYQGPIKSSGDIKKNLASVKEGGNQTEFEDEDPEIHRGFVEEVEASGAQCLMCDYFPRCPKKC